MARVAEFSGNQTVYVRKNRSGKYGTTYHVSKTCPMIKNNSAGKITGVALDTLFEDITKRNKTLTICKICTKMAEEPTKEAETVATN